MSQVTRVQVVAEKKKKRRLLSKYGIYEKQEVPLLYKFLFLIAS